MTGQGGCVPGSELAASLWWAVDPVLLQPVRGKVRLMSPNARKRVLVSNDTAHLIIAAQDGIPKAPRASMRRWPERRYTSVTQGLADYGYLVDHAERREAPGPWRYWGPLAWAYHDNSTQPGIIDAGVSLDAEEESDRRPSPFRDLTHLPVLLLPRLSARSDRRFIEVLEARRTHREFIAAAISAEELSDILRYSFGPLRFADAGALGVMQLRAAASGGARHETDACVYVFSVNGIRPGLYIYDNLRHGLVGIREGLLREEFFQLTFGQKFSRDAAFGVITVALTQRMSWKYRSPGAYRVILQNTGCVAQVFSMMCASLGLGASMTGAVRMEAARAALGLESASELVTFAMCCGKPVLDPEGLPASVPAPSSPFNV